MSDVVCAEGDEGWCFTYGTVAEAVVVELRGPVPNFGDVNASKARIVRVVHGGKGVVLMLRDRWHADAYDGASYLHALVGQRIVVRLIREADHRA